MWIQTEHLIAGGTTNTEHSAERAVRHLWSLVSAVSFAGGVGWCISMRTSSPEDCCRVPQRRGAKNAPGCRNGKECQHPLSFSSHQSPGQTCKEVPGEEVSSCSRKGSGAHATARVQRAGLGTSSAKHFCTDAERKDRKTGLGDGLGAQGASENGQGNKEKYLSGSAFQALLSRRHRLLSHTWPGRRSGLEPLAICLLRAASP